MVEGHAVVPCVAIGTGGLAVEATAEGGLDEEAGGGEGAGFGEAGGSAGGVMGLDCGLEGEEEGGFL